MRVKATSGIDTRNRTPPSTITLRIDYLLDVPDEDEPDSKTCSSARSHSCAGCLARGCKRTCGNRNRLTAAETEQDHLGGPPIHRLGWPRRSTITIHQSE